MVQKIKFLKEALIINENYKENVAQFFRYCKICGKAYIPGQEEHSKIHQLKESFQSKLIVVIIGLPQFCTQKTKEEEGNLIIIKGKICLTGVQKSTNSIKVLRTLNYSCPLF